MWTDTEEFVLFGDSKRHIIMAIPGKKERLRICHQYNSMATAILKQAYGNVDSIFGTVYIFEELYDCDSDCFDEHKDFPVTDLSNKSIVNVVKSIARIFDIPEQEEEDEEEDEE